MAAVPVWQICLQLRSNEVNCHTSFRNLHQNFIYTTGQRFYVVHFRAQNHRLTQPPADTMDEGLRQFNNTDKMYNIKDTDIKNSLQT
jgi:RNA polymerase-interacting CarD/CdnL/TRCF family regulator